MITAFPNGETKFWVDHFGDDKIEAPHSHGIFCYRSKKADTAGKSKKQVQALNHAANLIQEAFIDELRKEFKRLFSI